MTKPLGLSRSVAWVSSSLILAQGLRLLQGVVVARWLGPTEMGLNAYVYSILTLLDLLRAIGAEQIYIARSPSEPEAEAEWLAGCWNARLVLACIVGLLMFLGGLAVSTIDGEERLGGLLMMLSLMSPMLNLRSAELIHQQKVQNFGPLSRFEMIAAMLQALIPLAVVYVYRSVEALVIANIAAAAIGTALSHLMFPMRFSLRVPPALRAELWFYGRNNIATSVLTTLHTNLDNFAVGSFIGRAALGIYATGYRLAMTPHGVIKPVAERLLVPSYRQAHDRGLSELVPQWRAGFRFLAVSYAATSSLLILLADRGVELLLGPAWAGMAYVLVFTSFIAFFRGVAVTISPLMVIRRAPHKDARFKAVEVSVFAAFVAVGALSGRIEWLLAGGVASYFLAFWLRWRWWQHELKAAAFEKNSMRELAYPICGLLTLLIACAIRLSQADPIIAAVCVSVLMAVPLAITAMKLIATTELSKAS
jgi:O-antigen/teichoic acid export membrane protein